MISQNLSFRLQRFINKISLHYNVQKNVRRWETIQKQLVIPANSETHELLYKILTKTNSAANSELGLCLSRNTDAIRFSMVYYLCFPPSPKQTEEIMKWFPTANTFDAFLKRMLNEKKEVSKK